MKAVLATPLRSRCGVAVTGALWARGMAEAGCEVRIVCEDPARTAEGFKGRLVEADPVVSGLPVIPAWGRPDMAYPAPNPLEADRYWRERPGDLDYGAAEHALRGCGPGDVLFLEQSAAVILPAAANTLLRLARARSLATVVRVHSQLLQGLHPDLADVIAAPFPLRQALALADCDFTPDDASRWHEAAHPVAAADAFAAARGDLAPGPAPASGPGPRSSFEGEALEEGLVIGYGGRDRMPHGFVGDEVAEAGGRYEAAGTGDGPWRPLGAVVAGLRRAAVIALFYPETPGVGRSSALSVALGADRPVVCSDAGFLSDARAWGGTCDDVLLDRALREALALGGAPRAEQVLYAHARAPRASALTLLDRALG